MEEWNKDIFYVRKIEDFNEKQKIKLIYLVWMTFALILSWIMTILILSILFFVIITFIRLVESIFGKTFLELNESKESVSYWNHKVIELEKNQDYEKQY